MSKRTSISRRPILFHDIDGVLFGQYGDSGTLQLRPGLNDWLKWATENFTVVWLTSWEEEKIRTLLAVTYNGHIAKATKYGRWSDYLKKVYFVINHFSQSDWFWIDDEPQDEKDLLKLDDARRFVLISAHGADTLKALPAVLTSLVEAVVPPNHLSQ